MLVDELSWVIDDDVDEEGEARRLLCIELPKKSFPSGTGKGARVDCIFDESLHIDGTLARGALTWPSRASHVLPPRR